MATKYEFTSRYGSGYGVRVNPYGVDKPSVQAVFLNGIYVTEKKEVAEALKRHGYFNIDFFLNAVKMPVIDEIGDEHQELADLLDKKKFFELKGLLRRIDTRNFIRGAELNKMKKPEIISFLLKKAEKTKAELGIA